MSVRVSIEASVWSDARYDVLAEALDIDRYSAVGRMAAVWAMCTHRETDRLKATFVGALLGVGPARAGEVLDDAELGEVTDDGQIRIRGCGGRTEWLSEKRDTKRKGGRARAKRAKRNADGSFATSTGPAAGDDVLAKADDAQPAGASRARPASRRSGRKRDKKSQRAGRKPSDASTEPAQGAGEPAAAGVVLDAPTSRNPAEPSALALTLTPTLTTPCLDLPEREQRGDPDHDTARARELLPALATRAQALAPRGSLSGDDSAREPSGSLPHETPAPDTRTTSPPPDVSDRGRAARRIWEHYLAELRRIGDQLPGLRIPVDVPGAERPVLELLRDGLTADGIEHAVACYVAEVEQTGKVRWLSPSTLFAAKQVRRVATSTVEAHVAGVLERNSGSDELRYYWHTGDEQYAGGEVQI